MRPAGSCAAVVLVCLSASAQDLVKIPASAKEVTDVETGIKIAITAGEFLISRTEVTQAEFLLVMGFNPANFQGPRRPVENVSWWDAIRYCNLRSRKEGLEVCYDLDTGRCDRTRNGYRLPSDAEWEFASAGSDPKQAHLGSRDTKDTDALRTLAGQGPSEVASLAPNQFGLYDMLGNVWEWTDDYFNPAPNTPQQNERGLARILRGGSYVSTTSGWARGYRTSLEPERKSRFTGFRVVRTVTAESKAPAIDAGWFEPYNKPPAGYEMSAGALAPLISPGDDWKRKRQELFVKWKEILGTPRASVPKPQAKLVETIREFHYTAKLMYLRVEPDFWEKILIAMPLRPARTPTPVVIVPYYDVDVPAGRNLGGRSFTPGYVRSYAYLAAQRGFIAVAIRWFGESYGERYDEAVANLALRHPGCTGLGKWVWDAQRLLDYLCTLPEVDRERIGIIGHSLGAKMALYAAAMDERIKAVVFSEGGIGFRMSNYDDYWYLGERMKSLPPGTDQHELLALIAPRAFLLIGGDEYDKAGSWHYVNAARAVYETYGRPRQIGYFNHHSGHTPTPEAVWHAMRWLEHFVGR